MQNLKRRCPMAELRKGRTKIARDRQKFKHEAEEYATICIGNIREMVEALEAAGDNDTEREDAEQTIQEDPLSVEVRSGWYSPNADASDRAPAEYNILITTGGPAARIIGELDSYGQPETARFEYQDWFQPWTDVPVTDEKDRETLLTYARCFWFGEGQ